MSNQSEPMLPPWMVQGMMDLNTILKNSWAAGTNTKVSEITGHAARGFADFAKESAAAWAKK